MEVPMDCLLAGVRLQAPGHIRLEFWAGLKRQPKRPVVSRTFSGLQVRFGNHLVLREAAVCRDGDSGQ